MLYSLPNFTTGNWSETLRAHMSQNLVRRINQLKLVSGHTFTEYADKYKWDGAGQLGFILGQLWFIMACFQRERITHIV